MKSLRLGLLILPITIIISCACSKGGGSSSPVIPPVTPPAKGNPVDYWITRGDQSSLLESHPAGIYFTNATNSFTDITVDSTQAFQTVDGFGYTLTGGSAQLINALDATTRTSLLQELFGAGPSGRGISYLRISIGASDLSDHTYTYDDIPSGSTDMTLASFSLDPDRTGGSGLIPLLKQVLAINPNIRILGSPWSPPTWMKDNGNFKGGSLKPEYDDVYAQYFVRYLQAMKSEGITIDAITPQNEPLNPNNTPSLLMTSDQERDFIKGSLGPAFRAAGIATKIIVWDHNCDVPAYPVNILNDAAAKGFVDGSAFHLYAGDISALSNVHNQHPDKSVYFTEQWTGATSGFSGDLMWHLKNVVIGSMRNWSRNALEWNLANDPLYGPHTPGGCTECKGALTINGNVVTRNVSYYIIAHASSFVPAGSLRIASTQSGSLSSVAFLTPAGKKVLIVLNDGSVSVNFNIASGGQKAVMAMPASSVATFTW
jgi:glucosylceramidase